MSAACADRRRGPDLDAIGIEAGGGERTPSSRRYLDQRHGMIHVNVVIGEHYVSSSEDEILVTLLGSCVSACIRDPVAAIGGMNHFLLPSDAAGSAHSASDKMRYGCFAMERLINDVLSAGGKRERLEAKVFGGANVIKASRQIGDANVEFVREYLANERIPIVAADLGGDCARRIRFQVVSGVVQRLELRRQSDLDVFGREIAFSERVLAVNVEGAVDLFQ